MSKKAEVIKYVTTNGLFVSSDKLKKPTLCKVWFAVMSDNTVKATVENANTGSQIKSIGSRIISRQELSDLPEDAYDEMVFNRAAFALFGISI